MHIPQTKSPLSILLTPPLAHSDASSHPIRMLCVPSGISHAAVVRIKCFEADTPSFLSQPCQHELGSGDLGIVAAIP